MFSRRGSAAGFGQDGDEAFDGVRAGVQAKAR
jgi:hypothetical protein